MSDINDKIEHLNSLLKEVQAYKQIHPETRLGFQLSFSGLLNAYREGDLSFDECVAYLGKVKPTQSALWPKQTNAKGATLQYKCRRCDAIVEKGCYGDERKAFQQLVITTGRDTGEMLQGDVLPMTQHHCEDDGHGVADFIGYRLGTI